MSFLPDNAVLPTSVPYQSNSLAFDPLAVNPYNMQQTFPVSFSPAMSQAVSYPGTSTVQSLPTTREVRNSFALGRSPLVKAESTSPVQSHQAFNEMSYSDKFNRSISEHTENSNAAHFSTDVDTLMKAIQAKQPTKPAPEPVKVCHSPAMVAQALTPAQEEGPKPGQKAKKRYKCHLESCGKSFYQKTHLDIHRRSHNGEKPFVSFSFRL